MFFFVLVLIFLEKIKHKRILYALVFLFFQLDLIKFTLLLNIVIENTFFKHFKH